VLALAPALQSGFDRKVAKVRKKGAAPPPVGQ